MRESDNTVNPADRKYTVLLESIIDNLETMIEANMRAIVSIIAQTYASFPKLSFSLVFPMEKICLFTVNIIYEMKNYLVNITHTYLGS